MLAPADGIVTYVLDGRPDQPIGSVDERSVRKSAGDRHRVWPLPDAGAPPRGSITSRRGPGHEGQPIARVGNSGDQRTATSTFRRRRCRPLSGTSETIDLPQLLTTLHTYPLLFRDASLIRGGVETRPSAVEPRRGDVIRPTN